MKRNRKPSLSGTTGENNNTPNVNKKQRVLFTSCRRLGLTRSSSKTTNNPLQNVSQTSASSAFSKELTKPKSLELIEKLSVFDFPDSPRSSPQDSTKIHDVPESNTDIDLELCSFIAEPLRGKLKESTTPKKGISNKATEPVQLSIEHNKTHNLSPCVLLCKLDLNKIKISSPYTISDSEESEKSKSPNKIAPKHKKSIGMKIELLTKSSNDVESEISLNSPVDDQFNKFSKTNENISTLKHQKNVLTPNLQTSLNNIDDFVANETEKHSRLSNDCVKDDDAVYYSPIIKRRKSKVSLSLKNKASDLQNNELSSPLSNRLNENFKDSCNVKNDEGIRELDEITIPQNIIGTSGSDSDEPLITTSKKLKCTKLGNLQSKVLEKQETPANLKTENLQPSLNLVKEINAPVTILPNPTSTKQKTISSESHHSTEIHADLQPDENLTSLNFTSEHLELAKPEYRPTVKSKGSRKHYHDMPPVLPLINYGYADPEKFGWEKHESLANTNIAKNQDINITAVAANETQKSLTLSKPENSEWEKRESTKYKIKELQINLTPISIKEIHASTKHSQSQDSETNELNTAKHKKTIKSQGSVWEKFKTEAKRKQDASSLKHNTSTKPEIQHSVWEKPVTLKPKQIQKHAFQSEDWNKELQELDMRIQSKINLKRKTKLPPELQHSDLITETKEPNTNIQTNKEIVSSKHKKTKIIPDSHKTVIQLNKKSESTKPKQSTEIPSSEFQYAEGEIVKNILSLVNPANLNDLEYIKAVAESKGSILDKEKFSSIESIGSVKESRVPVSLPSTKDKMKQSKSNAELQNSFKETKNLDKGHSIESKDSVLESVQKKQNRRVKKPKKNVSQPQELDKDLHLADSLGFKHKKSTTLFPSAAAQDTIKDLLELDVNSQSNILSDDESINSELDFLNKSKSPKLVKSILTKKSMFTTAIQRIRKTDGFRKQRLQSTDTLDTSLMSHDSFSTDSNHTEKRKRSTSAKHKKHATKSGPSNRSDNSEKSSQSLNYSDSEDDFKVKPRRRKSSMSNKTDDKAKAKKLFTPLVDAFHKTEHIRIRENTSYTIIYKGNIVSYVKSHDNDVEMKTTESDDNQQAPALIKTCTKLPESQKSMILERRNYTSTNACLSISDKENSENDDTEYETTLFGNLVKKIEPATEQIRKTNENKKLTNRNEIIEDRKVDKMQAKLAKNLNISNTALEDQNKEFAVEKSVKNVRKIDKKQETTTKYENISGIFELTGKSDEKDIRKIYKKEEIITKNRNIIHENVSVPSTEIKEMDSKKELADEKNQKDVRKIDKKEEMIAKNANISVLSTDILEPTKDVEKYIKKIRKINKKQETIVTNPENISTLSMVMLAAKDKNQESVVEKNKNIENEKIALRNALFEARTKHNKPEPVIEKTVNNETEMNEKEESAIRNELEARNHKQHEFLIEPIQTIEKETITINNEKEITKNIEQEKLNIRNELSVVRKDKRKEVVAEKMDKNLSSENIEQEKLNIRNELLEVRKERKELVSELKKNKKEVVAETIEKNLSSENIELAKLNIRNELLEGRKKDERNSPVNELIQKNKKSEDIEHEKSIIRRELLEARKKDKRRMSEKIRKHKAKQQIKESSIPQTDPTNGSIASTSNAVANIAIDSMMNVEQIKQEMKATEARLKERQDILDRLKRLQVYKKAHDLQELRKITLQIKSGCREALIDLLLVLKEHSNSHIDMGTLLHNMKITNDLVGYNEEEDIFE